MNDLTPAQAIPLVDCHGDHVTTTSLRIAQTFGKQHFNVLKAIERLECSQQFRQFNFELTPYLDAQGKPRTMYELTRDGFVFLAMGFTGAQAAQWKEAYIAAFNRMEAELRAGDAKQLARVQSELARTQRQLIVAQKALLADARRRLREYLPARAARVNVPAAQMPLDLEGGAA